MWNKLGVIGSICSILGLLSWLFWPNSNITPIEIDADQNSVVQAPSNSPNSIVQNLSNSPDATQVSIGDINITYPKGTFISDGGLENLLHRILESDRKVLRLENRINDLNRSIWDQMSRDVERIEKTVDEAIVFSNDNNYQQAFTHFISAVTQIEAIEDKKIYSDNWIKIYPPGVARVYFLGALSAMKLNDFETCSNLSKKAYEQYPEPDFLVPSLYILLMEDQWDKASRLVKSALSENPSSEWLMKFEAAIKVQGYIHQHQSVIRDRSTAAVLSKSAVIAYEAAVQRWGQDEFSVVYPKSMARDLYRIAAVSANRANQFHEALNFAEKSLALGWSYLGCKSKAIQLLNLGRVQEALKLIETAIIKHPSNQDLKAFQKRVVDSLQLQKQLIGNSTHVPGRKSIPLKMIVVDEN